MGTCDPAYGGCSDGSVTGKEEGVGFTHTVGGAHGVVPFLSACLGTVTITPQVDEGSGYVNMTLSTTKIQTNPSVRKPVLNRPCIKNASFTLTPNTGSGGSLWNCRYKISNRSIFISYVYFNVTVNAPVSTGAPQIIIAT